MTSLCHPLTRAGYGTLRNVETKRRRRAYPSTFLRGTKESFAAMTSEFPWLRSGLSNKSSCPPFFLSLPNRLVKEELLTPYSESKISATASRLIAFRVVSRLSFRQCKNPSVSFLRIKIYRTTNVSEEIIYYCYINALYIPQFYNILSFISS